MVTPRPQADAEHIGGLVRVVNIDGEGGERGATGSQPAAFPGQRP